jgi:hypothetical protein
MIQHGKGAKPDETGLSPECEDFERLITEFFEGDGGTELRVELEEHSRSCSHCAEIFRSYVVTMRTCRSAPRVAEPTGTHKKLWDELGKEMAALRAYLK